MPAVAPKVVILTIPLPPKGCSPNVRGHWSKKAKAVKQYREEGWIAARNAKVRGALQPFEGLVIIDHEWYMGPTPVYDKRERPRDADNRISSLKGAVDGFADAGILKGDTAELVAWGECTAHTVKKHHGGKALVRLTLRLAVPMRRGL